MHNKLGDFTSTPRMIVISGMALVIGLVSACVALGLLKLIGLFTNLFFFRTLERRAGLSGGEPPGLAGDSGAGGGRPDHRRDGALRFGAHSRPRNSRGH